MLPGGNWGDPDSEHYSDQLELWASGEYKRVGFDIEGERAFTFVEDE